MHFEHPVFPCFGDAALTTPQVLEPGEAHEGPVESAPAGEEGPRGAEEEAARGQA